MYLTLKDPLNNKQEFFLINGLRFFAAFWVLIFHTSIHFGKPNSLAAIQPILDQGVLAMTLFFMLSGFILSYRYSTFSTPEDSCNYFAARVARLYPVYLFMGVTTLWKISEGTSQFWLFERFGSIGAVPFIIVVVFFVYLFIASLVPWAL